MRINFVLIWREYFVIIYIYLGSFYWKESKLR